MFITYLRFVVAFIDILGFGRIIEKGKNMRALNKLRSDLIVAGNVVETDEYEQEELQHYSKMFSDSVTMSRFVDKGTLYPFLLDVIRMQGELSYRGVFIRGVIAVGDHYEDDRILFGPALIKAVEMERTLAIWPRIVIHPDVIKLANDPTLWLHPNAPEQEEVMSLLKCDRDGISYTNYLEVFPTECDTDKLEGKFLVAHQKNILKKATENQSDLRILSKYHWLAIYHNSVMIKLKRDNLCIDIPKYFVGLH